MFIADLHIHSKYARATSRESDIPHLELWARRKGITLVGTGDFTHPAWRDEMREFLEPCGGGLYAVKDKYKIEPDFNSSFEVRFILSAEISCIYKRADKVRKVHNVILLPSIDEADKLSWRLEAVGNIRSDGRPILGLDSEQLLKLTLESCPDAIFIPAHIWTPHFSALGAFSAFNSIEECYGGYAKYISAVETGLSSDPPMNWRVSQLDRFTLVSNSDAHSPSKLGREANMLDCELSFSGLKHALESGSGFLGTIEFFPEEGKYHLDGHRKCALSVTPDQYERYGGLCPVCGKKLTVGVLHRLYELADRPDGVKPARAKGFESIVPLCEVIADSLGMSAAAKKVQDIYFKLLNELGPEFYILRAASLADISALGLYQVGAAIGRMRDKKVIKQPGFDGQYGIISLFSENERQALKGQTALFDLSAPAKKAAALPLYKPEKTDNTEIIKDEGLNSLQQQAVNAVGSCVIVSAGPGAGKTRVLCERIAWIVEKGADPCSIAAVTFTRRAAEQMQTRLAARLGQDRAQKIRVGTFHSVALSLLKEHGVEPKVLNRGKILELCDEIIQSLGLKISADKMLNAISLFKNTGKLKDITENALDLYNLKLCELGAMDFDDIIDRALTYTDSFGWLLVDEFQDINPKQYELTLKWSNGKNLFVIGDPNQAIYGFRGASSEFFDKLKSARGANVISLVDNYRSSPQILSAAARVLKSAAISFSPLTPHAQDGVKVRVLTANDRFSQSVFVAKEIAKMAGGTGMIEAQDRRAGEHFSFSQIAVLCRTNRELLAFEKCLKVDSIPCIKYGGDDFLADPNVQRALSFFEILESGPQSPALESCLGGFGVMADIISVVKARSQAGVKDINLLVSDFAGVFAVDLFLKAYNKFSGRFLKDSPTKLLRDFAALLDTELKGSYLKFVNASVFDHKMPRFLERVRLAGQWDIGRALGTGYALGAVHLLTMHAAKGLEFDAVFACGIDSEFERAGKTDTMQKLENARLLYVALTRAKRELVITGVKDLMGLVSGFDSHFARYGALPVYGAAARAQQLSLF